MSKPRSIAIILAELIVQGNMPLRAVSIAGEVIVLDARISDYGSGIMRQSSLEEIERVAENYDILLKKSQAAANDFLETKDKQSITKNLTTIKEMLTAIS